MFMVMNFLSQFQIKTITLIYPYLLLHKSKEQYQEI